MHEEEGGLENSRCYIDIKQKTMLNNIYNYERAKQLIKQKKRQKYTQ